LRLASRIYSASTRHVWHVLHPDKAIKLLLVFAVVAILIGGIIYWFASGGSTHMFELLLQKK
jgi:hypothetical protein